MKKATLSILISILLCLQALAQSCLPNGIQFQRQGQIDSFTLNYPGCTVIEGGISFYGPTIVNLNGLSGLTAIVGFLQIGNAPNLTSLNGLENVTSIGSLQMYQSSLENLNGLEQITSVGDIDINGNIEMISLTGLNNLDSIGSHLLIRWNPKLTSLDGLENLRVVGGDFGIWANPLLTSLEDLEHLTSVGEVNEAEGMNIFNNALLSECAIGAVCEHLIHQPNTSYISNNAASCESNMEVHNQCLIGTNETLHKRPISIFPNPNNGAFTVKLPEPVKPGTMFRITDLMGRLLQEQKTEPGNAEQMVRAEILPEGLYFLQVVSEGILLAVEKFVKA
ncbi:MAG: T9SS type A sorting domain-containing protein [Saprospiraceae bacterium]|nr:T9SS type A sorting domain-containing protein [Saprospiraceae bacterium]